MGLRVISVWVDDSDLPLSHLRAHLLSLRRQCSSSPASLHLIVGEGRDPAGLGADLWDGVTVAQVPEDRVWAERARAVDDTADVAVLTTSRALVEEGWLELLAGAVADDHASAGGPVDTTALNNPYERAADELPALPTPFGRGAVPWPHSIAYRAEAVRAAGGLDADLSGWAQDIDLHWRLGHPPRVVPEARALVRGPRTWRAHYEAGVREGLRDAALLRASGDDDLVVRYAGRRPPIVGAARRVARAADPRSRSRTMAQLGLVVGRRRGLSMRAARTRDDDTHGAEHRMTPRRAPGER